MKTILLLVLCCQFSYTGMAQHPVVDTSGFNHVQHRLFNRLLELEMELAAAFSNRHLFKGEEYYDNLLNYFLNRIHDYHRTSTFPNEVSIHFIERLAKQLIEFNHPVLILYGKTSSKFAETFNGEPNNLNVEFIGLSYCEILLPGYCFGCELKLPDYISKAGKGRYQIGKQNFNYVYDAYLYEYFNELILRGLDKTYGAKMVKHELSNYHHLAPKPRRTN